jgi:hypothetical protein
MKLTVNDIVNKINTELELCDSYPDSGVLEIRAHRLKAVKDFLILKGFPDLTTDKLELSLHPFYFQEVNYDDLDIYTIDGDMGHLKNVYEIDLAVQTGGYTRGDISASLYESYLSNRSQAISYWREGRDAGGSQKKIGFFARIVSMFKR